MSLSEDIARPFDQFRSFFSEVLFLADIRLQVKSRIGWPDRELFCSGTLLLRKKDGALGDELDEVAQAAVL